MRNLLIALLFIGIFGCSSDKSDSSLNTQSLVGEWQYAGNYDDDPSARIPGFLKEHGYIFRDDGTWIARSKSDINGTYSLDGDQLMIEGRALVGGQTITKVMLENDYLIIFSDASIRDKDDKPAKVRYKRIN